MNYKICTKCKEEKLAISEHYYPTKTGKFGFSSECKECNKKYREINRDRIIKRSKDYRQKNLKQHKEYMKQWHEENKEREARYEKNNKDRIKRVRQKWNESNRELRKVYRNKARSLKSKLEADLTIEEWLETIDYFGGLCAYCGCNANLTQDHFIPMGNGGRFTKWNIIPCCFSCNAKKSNIDFHKWYPKCEFYSIEREIKILSFINFAEVNEMLKGANK